MKYKPRKPNIPAVVGGISLTTLGARRDEPEYEQVPAHRMHDIDLVRVLAARGYDVRCKVPSEKTLNRRRLELYRRAGKGAR